MYIYALLHLLLLYLALNRSTRSEISLQNSSGSKTLFSVGVLCDTSLE